MSGRSVGSMRMETLPTSSASSRFLTSRAVSFDPQALLGVTGERNTYTLHPRGTVMCLGPTVQDLVAQILLALGTGNRVVLVQARGDSAANQLMQVAPLAALDTVSLVEAEPDTLLRSALFDVVLFDGAATLARAWRAILAQRDGPRIALLKASDDAVQLCVERVVSEDTTAAGGNTTLLALSH